jgi:hypothetical protein
MILKADVIAKRLEEGKGSGIRIVLPLPRHQT